MKHASSWGVSKIAHTRTLRLAACRFLRRLLPVNIDRFFPDICDIVERVNQVGDATDGVAHLWMSPKRVLCKNGNVRHAAVSWFWLCGEISRRPKMMGPAL
jgi:hypothetical protein